MKFAQTLFASVLFSTITSSQGNAVEIATAKLEASAAQELGGVADRRRELQEEPPSAFLYFRLFNSTKDLPLLNLDDGDSFNLFVTGKDLNIRADFFDREDPDLVPGSIGFLLSSNDESSESSTDDEIFDNTEEFDLVVLEGDNSDDSDDGQISVGSFTLTATAYSGSDGSGDILATTTITFSVTEEVVPAVIEIFRVTAPGGEIVEDTSCPVGVCFYPTFYDTMESLTGFSYIAKVKGPVQSVKATMGRAFPGNGFSDLILLEETITNVEPYSLSGSDASGLIPFAFDITSSNVLSFTAFSGPDGTGEAGPALEVTVVPGSCFFEISDFDFCPFVATEESCSEEDSFVNIICPSACGVCDL